MVLFVGTALAQNPPPSGPSDRPPGGGQPGQQPQQPSVQDLGRKERARISGRILPAKGEYHLPEMIIANIVSMTGGFRETVMVRSDGSFEFKNVPGGNFTITVESPGYETVEQSVDVDSSFAGSANFVIVTMGHRLPEGDQPPANPQDTVVSAADFNIPKEAVKELEKASRESQNKKPEKAVEHLKKAIAIHPNFYQAYNNLAVQYLRLGKPSEAIEAFEKSTSINPKNGTAYRNLGIIHLNHGDARKSLDMLRKALELEPNHGQTHLYLGEAYFQMGQYVLAITSYQNAALYEPKLQNAHLRMGHCYVQIGRAADALKEFELFLAAEPKSEHADEVRAFISQLRR